MKIFLRLKAWQLFVLSCPLYFPLFNNIVFQICYFFGIVIYFGWIFSLGFVMHSFIQSSRKPKLFYFEISCVLPFVIIVISYFISLERINEFMGFVVAGFVLIALFYSYMFAARMFESVKQGEIVNRSDSVRTFFYVWFFPIGLWLLQPSINRIMAERDLKQT